MREERIVVHPFEELRVEEYRGFQQINEHATVKISGQIPYEKKCNAALCSRRKKHFIFDSINTITAPSFR